MYEELKTILETGQNTVFLGGAGVSTESGIPDFRSGDSAKKAEEKYGYPPEILLSHSFFTRSPEIFFDYYANNLLYLSAEPNNAHKALAKLEQEGKLSAIVTQNIDGLHHRAGSKTVRELHGSVHRNYCQSCGARFDDPQYIIHGVKEHKTPKCEKCGGLVRPDVVLYEEGLDPRTLLAAQEDISRADTLVVGGTSLVVWPAAGLLQYFSGKHLILINKTPTQFDGQASMVLREPIGEVLGSIL